MSRQGLELRTRRGRVYGDEPPQPVPRSIARFRRDDHARPFVDRILSQAFVDQYQARLQLRLAAARLIAKSLLGALRLGLVVAPGVTTIDQASTEEAQCKDSGQQQSEARSAVA